MDDVILKREPSALRPVFDDDQDTKSAGHERTVIRTPDRAVIDADGLGQELAVEKEYRGVLDQAVRKLEKAIRSSDEPASGTREERGVREL